MLVMPPAHAREIEALQAKSRRTLSPTRQAGYEAAIDLMIARVGRPDPFASRNALRDGRILAKRRLARAAGVVELDHFDGKNHFAPIDTRPSPEREAIFKDELRRLEQRLLERSGRAREVLACWAGEMNVSETAAAMRISEGRVKQLRRLVKSVALSGPSCLHPA